MNKHHKQERLSWKMKAAIALFLLPLPYFALSCVLRWPLPTLPFLNLSDGPAPEHIIFMAYRPESIPASLMACVILVLIGLVLILVVGLKQCGYTLQQDIHTLFGTYLPPPEARLERPEQGSGQSAPDLSRLTAATQPPPYVERTSYH